MIVGMEAEAEMAAFVEKVLAVFPEAVISEDDDGQLVINTNLCQNEFGKIVSMGDFPETLGDS